MISKSTRRKEEQMLNEIDGLVDYLSERARIKKVRNCLMMSQFVQFHIALVFGMKTEIKAAWVKTENDFVLHYFVEMYNGRIVDATASQFDGMPKVYIGERPKNYLHCKS